MDDDTSARSSRGGAGDDDPKAGRTSGDDEPGSVPDEQSIPPTLSADVFDSGERGTGGYLYRPGQILAPTAILNNATTTALTDAGFEPDDEHLGVVRYKLDVDEPRGDRIVPEFVDRLRHENGTHVFPNHVFLPHKHMIFGPATPPTPAGSRRFAVPAGSDGSGVRIVVIDTGITMHEWFDHRFDAEPPSTHEEVGAQLDQFDGHGTFIASVVLRYAPGAEVTALRAGHRGSIDDWELARQIETLAPDTDIMNLSFGGFTADDHGLALVPRAISDAQAANPELVFVAAAGNAGVTRPFFPAALGHPVLAVAACDDQGRLTRFSNRGPWITCRAPGFRELGAYVEPQGTPPPAHGSWVQWSGTSFAAPYVAGAIAAAWAGAGGAWQAVAEVLASVPFSYRANCGWQVSATPHAAIV